MKKYNSLDLLKIILALFVVAIHVDPLVENKYPIYELFLSSAVPCFFMISSYLIYKKNTIDNETIKRHLYKIFKLYLIWTLIYLPITIYFYAVSGGSMFRNFLSFFRKLILVGEQQCSYPLWYLLATIYCLAIILIFKKFKIKDIYILIFAFVLYVFGLCINIYDIFKEINITIYNILNIVNHLFGSGRIFCSLLYFCIGMYISKNELKISIQYNLIALLALLLLNYYFNYQIFKLLFYIFLFSTFLSINLKDNERYYYYRRTSTIMYFTHMIFFFIYTQIVGIANCKGLIGYIFTISCTIIISLIICYFEKRKPHNNIFKNIF